MKNLMRFLLAVVALLAYSCTTDTTEELGVELGSNGAKTTITLSLEASRTQLGEKTDGIYPLYWSEGDAIAMNGVTSSAIQIVEGATSAAFTFDTQLERPWHVVYPAPAEGVTAVTEGCYPITFPATQNYVAGSFDPAAAAMYGYGDVAATPAEGEEATEAPSIAMQHLTGLLRFAPKGEVTLARMTITSESGAISGTYDVNCTNGELTAQEGKTSNVITLSFGDGLQLKADEATPIYVAVPAGEYDAIEARLVTTDDKVMVIKFSTFGEKAIKAGTVREFAEFAFTENSTLADEEGVFEIATFEDLQKFAKIAAVFAPRSEAKLVANIVVPEDAVWTPIEGFTKTFNGNNMSISGLKAPLFGSVRANIHDLSLTNVNITLADEYINIGAIACYIEGGALTNCSAEGSLTVNPVAAHGRKIAGLVGYLNHSSFTNCTNNVNILINGGIVTDINNTLLHIGGVSAWVTNPQCKIENTINNGTITVSGKVDRLNVGGLIGYIDAAAELDQCVNNGEMLLNADVLGTSFSTFTGFIGSSDGGFDTANPTFKVSNCTNNADVTFGAKGGDSVTPESGTTNCFTHVGGFFGVARDLGDDAFSTIFDKCYNRGNIEINILDSAIPIKLSGIASQIAGETTISNCVNYGKLSLIRGMTSDFFLGGLNAHAIIDTDGGAKVDITNSSNEGELYVSPNVVHQGVPYMGGIAGFIDSANTTYNLNNVHNKANITLANITTKANQYAGGLIGYVRNAKVSFTDCSNSGTLNYKLAQGVYGGTIYHAGIIGHCGASNVATFTNVVNSGDIIDESAATRVCVAGIVASTANNIILDNCSNSGDISYENKRDFNSKFLWLGGLTSVVLVYDDGKTVKNKLITINSGTNTGNLTVKNSTFVAGGQIGLGGITAQVPYYDSNTYYGSFKLVDCTNSGDLTISESTAPTDVIVGGILACNGTGRNGAGYAIIEHPVNTGNITVTNTGSTGFPLSVGRIVGELTGDETKVGANSAGERGQASGNIDINIYNTGNYYAIGGAIGATSGEVTISDIDVLDTNNSKMTLDLTNSLYNNSIGGIIGYMAGAPKLSNLTNAAPIEHTIGTCTNGIQYVGSAFGRITGAFAISNCSTSGDVTIAATTKITKEVNLGGILGLSDAAHNGITNSHSDATLTIADGTYAGVNVGGIVGNEHGVSDGGITNCYNSGEIVIEKGAALTSHLRLGGITGWSRGAKDSNLKNSGNINIHGTSATQMLIGGIYGYNSHTSYICDGGYENKGNITITGGTGTSTNVFCVSVGGIIGTLYCGISNATNIGDITVSGVSNTANSEIGGIVGYCRGTGEISNCKQHSNITAYYIASDNSTCVSYPNTGAITGAKRIATLASSATNYTAVVRNCEVGGSISTSFEMEDEVAVVVDLTAANFYNYIYRYGEPISWTNADNYDGCSFLATKPTVTVGE